MERIEWDFFASETKDIVMNKIVEKKEDDTNTKRIVVVWFHAEWCNPCKRIEPDVLKLVEEVGSSESSLCFYDIMVPKDDIEKNELKDTWGFHTIPTFFCIDVNTEEITERKWEEFKDFALSSN